MDTWLTLLFNDSKVQFNAFGVAQNGLRYKFGNDKLKVSLDVCCVNGIWAGSTNIMGKTWGCGGPISRSSFKYNSFEECTDYLIETVRRVISNRDGSEAYLALFKKQFKDWDSMTHDEKLSKFKEVYFYDPKEI